jgi:Zn-dependent protease
MEPNTPWSPATGPTPAPAAWGAPPPPPAPGDFGDPVGLPAPADHAFGQPRKPLLKRIGGGIAAGAALIAKFLAQAKALIFLLPKVKLFSFAASALVSVVAYQLLWGWWFAVGFVVLLFVHEMGHVLQLRREGIKATAPLFIPFLGAVVKAELWTGDAMREARVGLAGPVLGTIGAAACLPLYWATGNPMFLGLAYIGFLINLFNLLPVLPLDGGRAMAAMAPWMWFVGFLALIPAAIFFRGPIIFLVIIMGGYEIWTRWQQRRSGTLEQAAYYRVSPRNRLLVGAVYIGLIAVLAIGMHEAYIQRTIS